MDTLDSFIGTLTIIAAFSVVYERVQELIRAPRAALEKAKMLGLVELIDTLTIGSFNWVSGVVAAILTHADLLALLKSPDKFFELYRMSLPFELFLKSEPAGNDLKHFMGCIFMGLAAAQGARYWHDLLGHMIDLRTQAKHVTGGIGAASTQLEQAAQRQAPAGPVVEALQKVAASGEGAARPSAGS